MVGPIVVSILVTGAVLPDNVVPMTMSLDPLYLPTSIAHEALKRVDMVKSELEGLSKPTIWLKARLVSGLTSAPDLGGNSVLVASANSDRQKFSELFLSALMRCLMNVLNSVTGLKFPPKYTC
jgi:hypothetical protein